MQHSRSSQTFRRNILLPSSESKNKPIKGEERVRCENSAFIPSDPEEGDSI
jgi:hypothetical protein